MVQKKRIMMDSSAPIEEIFKRFLLSKKALGLAEKTLESYQQHLVAIRKHLDVTMMIDDLQKSDLEARPACVMLALLPTLSSFGVLKQLHSRCSGAFGEQQASTKIILHALAKRWLIRYNS